jgi:hypothetical protein
MTKVTKSNDNHGLQKVFFENQNSSDMRALQPGLIQSFRVIERLNA